MRTSALRISVLYAAIFAAALVLLLGVVYGLTARFLDAEVEAVIGRDVAALAEAFDRGGARRLISEVNLRSQTWGRTSAVYLLADDEGRVLAGNLPSWPVMRETTEPWVGFEVFVSDEGQEIRRSVRATLVEPEPGLRLLVGSDLSERQELTRRFAVAAGAGTVLVTLLALAVGYWQSRRILTRLAELNRSCAEILAGNLSRRLPLAGTDDEFDSLAKEVNELLNRLARTTEILRASLHSAAHDLRSPMHRMRLRLEQAALAEADGPGPSEVLLRELDHMQRVLTALLQIAEAESGSVGARPEAVALDQLLAELAELYQPQAEAQQVGLELAAAPGLAVRGHRQLLAQAVANLIDNALRFTPAGGRVSLGAGLSDGRLAIRVGDTGPGIPVAERSRAVDPFVRLGQGAARDSAGVGLGLSLVAAVARLHGGHLRLEDNHPGLLAILELPAAA